MGGKNWIWIIITAIAGALAAMGGFLFARRGNRDNSGIISQGKRDIERERDSIERERDGIERERSENSELGRIIEELAHRADDGEKP